MVTTTQCIRQPANKEPNDIETALGAMWSPVTWVNYRLEISPTQRSPATEAIMSLYTVASNRVGKTRNCRAQQTVVDARIIMRLQWRSGVVKGSGAGQLNNNEKAESGMRVP